MTLRKPLWSPTRFIKESGTFLSSGVSAFSNISLFREFVALLFLSKKCAGRLSALFHKYYDILLLT